MESRPAQAVDRASASGRLNNVWTRLRTSPRWIVAIALLLRVTWIVIGHTYKFKSSDDSFGFGWEMGRIGASLAAGHGFSSPFGPSTGPTAWEPPRSSRCRQLPAESRASGPGLRRSISPLPGLT